MNPLLLLSFLLAALVCCQIGSSEASGEVELLDLKPNFKLETVLTEVCKREIIIKISTMHHKQISKFSTLRDIAEYFKFDLDYDDEFKKCAKHNVAVVDRLLAVVETANEDVCSDAKLEQIENFHLDYVSKVKKHVKRQKKLGNEIPRILKNFFINYATLVSNKCELKAMSSLDEAKERFAKEMGSQTIDPEFAGFADRNFHQMVSVWNLLDALPWEDNEKFARYLSAKFPRVSMRVSNMENLPMMQGICKRIIPLYEKNILPLMKLIYMGYYPTSPSFKNALISDPKVTAFFQYIQMCEEVLPIQFYHDSNLKSDEVELVPLTDVEQGKKIVITADLMEAVVSKVDTSFVEVNDLLDLSGDIDLEQMVKTARSNISSRSGYMKSFLKKLYNFLKLKTKSQAHAKLIVPDTYGEVVAIPDEQPVATEEGEERVLRELEVDERNELENGPRVKRNIFVDIIKHSGQYILSFLLYIVYLIYYAFPKLLVKYFSKKVDVAVVPNNKNL